MLFLAVGRIFEGLFFFVFCGLFGIQSAKQMEGDYPEGFSLGDGFGLASCDLSSVFWVSKPAEMA